MGKDVRIGGTVETKDPEEVQSPTPGVVCSRDVRTLPPRSHTESHTNDAAEEKLSYYLSESVMYPRRAIKRTDRRHKLQGGTVSKRGIASRSFPHP